jgi:hypothetical protein
MLTLLTIRGVSGTCGRWRRAIWLSRLSSLDKVST